MANHFLRGALTLPFALAAGFAGCTLDSAGSIEGTSSSSSTSGEGAATATSTTTTTSSTGGGGGAGGGTETTCTPGETRACYSGPAGTEGIGLCVAGIETCAADGSAFGDCEGEVVPTSETCATTGDDDCNGMANEGGAGCDCTPGSQNACYSGPSGTEGVGPCAAGTQTCNQDGVGYGPCMGESLPGVETCNTPEDDDCDGTINEDGVGCICTPDATSPCFTSPTGTAGVGACVAGTWTCNDQGTAYGPCMGEIGPSPETCNTPVDDDCNGMTNEGGAGCVCLPNAMVPCYSGPAGTQNIGTCVGGLAPCDGQGLSLGKCVGDVVPAGENCATVADENCDGASPGCSGTHLGSAKFGDSSAQTGQAIAFDSAGDLLIAGAFKGSMVFGADSLNSGGSNTDLFFAKVTQGGTGVWGRKYGDNPSDQSATGIAGDASGNVIVTGYFLGNVDFGSGNVTAGGVQIFLAKFTSTGNHTWSKGFGDMFSQSGRGVAVDSGGNIFMTGQFQGAVDFGGGAMTTAGSDDIYLAKLDPSGAHIWSKKFGDASAQIGQSVAVDTQSNVIIAGPFQGAVNFGGGALTSAGFDDIYVAKFDPGGNHLWSKRFGDLSGQGVTAVAVGPNDEIGLTGSFKGTVDFGGGALTSAGGVATDDVYVAVFDSSGAHKWSKAYGDVLTQTSGGIAFDSGGNPVVTGYFQAAINFGGGAMTSAGADDIYLAKLDGVTGAQLWAKQFGDPGGQQAYAVATQKTTGIAAFIGNLNGTANLGGANLLGAGQGDVLVGAFGL